MKWVVFGLYAVSISAAIYLSGGFIDVVPTYIYFGTVVKMAAVICAIITPIVSLPLILYELWAERNERKIKEHVETYIDVKMLKKMKEKYRLAQIRAEVDDDNFYTAMENACRVEAIEKMIEEHERKEKRKELLGKVNDLEKTRNSDYGQNCKGWKKRGYEDGYKAGYNDGYEEALRNVSAIMRKGTKDNEKKHQVRRP